MLYACVLVAFVTGEVPIVSAIAVHRRFCLPLDVVRFGLNVWSYPCLPHCKGFWYIVIRPKSVDDILCGFFSGGIVYLVQGFVGRDLVISHRPGERIDLLRRLLLPIEGVCGVMVADSIFTVMLDTCGAPA